jgi:hypothetical protein
MSKSLRKPEGTFAPGWRGGGRPKGARAKLHELAVEMLRDDFEMHGREVIARVREKKPEVYLASVVSLARRKEAPAGCGVPGRPVCCSCCCPFSRELNE